MYTSTGMDTFKSYKRSKAGRSIRNFASGKGMRRLGTSSNRDSCVSLGIVRAPETTAGVKGSERATLVELRRRAGDKYIGYQRARTGERYRAMGRTTE